MWWPCTHSWETISTSNSRQFSKMATQLQLVVEEHETVLKWLTEPTISKHADKLSHSDKLLLHLFSKLRQEKWARTSQNFNSIIYLLRVDVCNCVRVCEHVRLHWLQLTVCCSVTMTNVEKDNRVILWIVFSHRFTAITTFREQSVRSFCCRLKISAHDGWVMNLGGESQIQHSNKSKWGLHVQFHWAQHRGCFVRAPAKPAEHHTGISKQRKWRVDSRSKCSWTQCPSMHSSPLKTAHQHVNFLSWTMFKTLL